MTIHIPFYLVLLAALIVSGVGAAVYLIYYSAMAEYWNSSRMEKARVAIGTNTLLYFLAIGYALAQPEKRWTLLFAALALGMLTTIGYSRRRDYREYSGYQPLSFRDRALVYLIVAAYIAPFCVVLGKVAGDSAGAATRARLELVWPGLMQMPVGDRAALVRLAIKCDVNRVPLDQKAILACLQEPGGSGEDVARLAYLMKQSAYD